MAISNDLSDIFRDDTTCAFLAQSVPRELIEQILELARRAPSGVNTQPWQVFVVQGTARLALVGSALEALPRLIGTVEGRADFWQQFNRQPGTCAWPGEGPQQTGDHFLAAAMAATDEATTQADLEPYFRFFDAPVGLIFIMSRDLGFGSLLDYGMFLQNIALAARARGLHTRIQTGWKGLADMVLPSLGAPEDAMLVCGMAFGYADASVASAAETADAPLVSSFTTWHA